MSNVRGRSYPSLSSVDFVASFEHLVTHHSVKNSVNVKIYSDWQRELLNCFPWIDTMAESNKDWMFCPMSGCEGAAI